MVGSRAAERFDALSTRTGELDDRSNRSLPSAEAVFQRAEIQSQRRSELILQGGS